MYTINITDRIVIFCFLYLFQIIVYIAFNEYMILFVRYCYHDNAMQYDVWIN